MLRRALLALVLGLAAGACNRIFTLDKTELATADASPCWDPAQMLEDDDLDGVVDGCDICPGDADELQADEDGDGVGDVCDPHPGDNRDRLAFFDGFVAMPDIPIWIAHGNRGTWSQSGGTMNQTVDRGSGTLILRKAFINPTVITTFTGQQPSIGPGTSIGGVVGVPPDAESEFPDSFHCHSFLSLSFGELLVLESYPLDGDPAKRQVVFPSGKRTRISFRSIGDCTARRDDRAFIGLRFNPLQPPAMGEIALRVTNTVASVHSVTVVETDP